MPQKDEAGNWLQGLETLESSFLLKDSLTCQFLGSSEFYVQALCHELLPGMEAHVLGSMETAMMRGNSLCQSHGETCRIHLKAE